MKAKIGTKVGRVDKNHSSMETYILAALAGTLP